MSYTPQNAWDTSPQTGLTTNPGPFLGEVMRNDDPLRSARLLVYIPDMGGDPALESSWHLCRFMSPFYGIQPLSNRLSADPAPPESLQSYGMWMTPPDVGVKVLVMFINGDRSRGVWIGCLPEIGSHGAVPGQDAGDFDVFSNYSSSNSDIASIPRPPHSTAPTFEKQGLADDTARGPITSSSLRESPSRVFGFNTPGSHSFVMDDGDAGGTNRLVRIRTASGNQIMMNDDTGFIYLINSEGTGWIELSPSGQIDVYGESGINLATPGSINLHADQDINMHANNNIKIVAGVGAKIQGTEEMQVHGKKLFLQGIDSIEQHSCDKIKITGNGGIDMFSCANFILQGRCFKWNSASAQEAEQVPPEQTTTVSGYTTTVTRAPNVEPWDGHDSGALSQTPGALTEPGASPESTTTPSTITSPSQFEAPELTTPDAPLGPPEVSTTPSRPATSTTTPVAPTAPAAPDEAGVFTPPDGFTPPSAPAAPGQPNFEEPPTPPQPSTPPRSFPNAAIAWGLGPDRFIPGEIIFIDGRQAVVQFTGTGQMVFVNPDGTPFLEGDDFFGSLPSQDVPLPPSGIPGPPLVQDGTTILDSSGVTIRQYPNAGIAFGAGPGAFTPDQLIVIGGRPAVVQFNESGDINFFNPDGSVFVDTPNSGGSPSQDVPPPTTPPPALSPPRLQGNPVIFDRNGVAIRQFPNAAIAFGIGPGGFSSGEIIFIGERPAVVRFTPGGTVFFTNLDGTDFE